MCSTQVTSGDSLLGINLTVGLYMLTFYAA